MHRQDNLFLSVVNEYYDGDCGAFFWEVTALPAVYYRLNEQSTRQPLVIQSNTPEYGHPYTNTIHTQTLSHLHRTQHTHKHTPEAPAARWSSLSHNAKEVKEDGSLACWAAVPIRRSSASSCRSAPQLCCVRVRVSVSVCVCVCVCKFCVQSSCCAAHLIYCHRCGSTWPPVGTTSEYV